MSLMVGVVPCKEPFSRGSQREDAAVPFKQTKSAPAFQTVKFVLYFLSLGLQQKFYFRAPN